MTSRLIQVLMALCLTLVVFVLTNVFRLLFRKSKRAAIPQLTSGAALGVFALVGAATTVNLGSSTSAQATSSGSPNCRSSVFTVQHNRYGTVGDDLPVTADQFAPEGCVATVQLSGAALKVAPSEPRTLRGRQAVTWAATSDQPGNKLLVLEKDGAQAYVGDVRFIRRIDFDLLWVATIAAAVLTLLLTWAPLKPVWVRLLIRLHILKPEDANEP